MTGTTRYGGKPLGRMDEGRAWHGNLAAVPVHLDPTVCSAVERRLTHVLSSLQPVVAPSVHRLSAAALAASPWSEIGIVYNSQVDASDGHGDLSLTSTDIAHIRSAEDSYRMRMRRYVDRLEADIRDERRKGPWCSVCWSRRGERCRGIRAEPDIGVGAVRPGWLCDWCGNYDEDEWYDCAG